MQSSYNTVAISTQSTETISMTEFIRLQDHLKMVENQLGMTEEKYVKTALKLAIVASECKRLQN